MLIYFASTIFAKHSEAFAVITNQFARISFKMLLVIFYVLSLFAASHSVEKSRGALGPRVFTFVHGDESGKLNFTAAENYCQSSVGGITEEDKAINYIGEKPILNHDKILSPNMVKHAEKSGLVLRTRLASLHSYPETLAIVKWISKQEKHSFWIGGQVTKSLNEYLRPIYVLHWTDGSRSDFSLFRLPNTEFDVMRVGERRCVSVDFLSGQWGVHPCSEKRYFVCLTVPVLSVSEKERKKHRNSSSNQILSAPINPHESLSAEELRRILS